MDEQLKAMYAQVSTELDDAYDAQEAEDAGEVGSDDAVHESSEFDDAYASVEGGAGESAEAVAPLDEVSDVIDGAGESAGAETDRVDDVDAAGKPDGGRAADEGAGEVQPPSWAAVAKFRREGRKYERQLRGAEKTVAQLEAEKAELLKKLEAVGEEYTPAPSGFDMSQLEKLREDYGDDIANAFEGLAKSTGVLGRPGAEVAAAADQVPDDAPQSFDELLDSAPDDAPIQQLGIWMDSNDPKDKAMLSRAQAIQNQLNQDPDFTGLDVQSFYNEVVNRTLSGHSQPTFVEKRDSGLPSSLSDAPGTTPANGSMANQFGSMTPKQALEFQKNAKPETLAALEDALWG